MLRELMAKAHGGRQDYQLYFLTSPYCRCAWGLPARMCVHSARANAAFCDDLPEASVCRMLGRSVFNVSVLTVCPYLC